MAPPLPIETVANPGGRARWPGRDGVALLIFGMLLVGVWLGRGRLGGEVRLGVALGVDLLWLGGTWLLRQPPRVAAPAGHRPLAVIPTKDNIASIGEVVRGCLAVCSDVLVVDDGSTDGSGEAAQAAGARVIRHGRNRGKGAALDSALCWAGAHGYSHIVALDADGQHDPADLPAFFAASKADPAAIFAGVRDMSTAPGSSQFGRRFSNFWIRVETGHQVADSQCGFRVYPVGPTLSLGLTGGRYEWEVEVLVRALWAGIAVRDLPCHVYYPSPEERVSSFRMFRDNVRISLINTRLVIARILWPARWFNAVTAPGGEWRGQLHGSVGGWAFLLGWLRLFGPKPTYALMAPMSAFYLMVGGSQRRGIQAWQARVGLPGLGNTWRIFYNFACSLVDRFLLLVRGPRAFQLEWEGREAVVEAVSQGGAIFLSAHLGNPELGAAGLQAGGEVTRVNIMQFTAGGDPYVALMRRYVKEREPPVIISLNEGANHAALEAARALRRGEIVAMKGDRPVDQRVARVPLLGGEISLATGPFLLAALTGAPVILLGCFKEGPGRYRVIAEPPRFYRFTSRKQRDADLHGWAAELAQKLEEWGRRWPLQWYNFHDPWAR